MSICVSSFTCVPRSYRSSIAQLVEHELGISTRDMTEFSDAKIIVCAVAFAGAKVLKFVINHVGIQKQNGERRVLLLVVVHSQTIKSVCWIFLGLLWRLERSLIPKLFTESCQDPVTVSTAV